MYVSRIRRFHYTPMPTSTTNEHQNIFVPNSASLLPRTIHTYSFDGRQMDLKITEKNLK
jgi:hypothetical protein